VTLAPSKPTVALVNLPGARATLACPEGHKKSPASWRF
jgi:hypothetical protein